MDHASAKHISQIVLIRKFTGHASFMLVFGIIHFSSHSSDIAVYMLLPISIKLISDRLQVIVTF